MYLRLLSRNLGGDRPRGAGARPIVVPELAGSLAVLFRRVHGRYAQYVNTRRGRSGHLATPLRYVEENPCRSGMVERAEDYRWSSAAVHSGLRRDEFQVLDLDFWGRAGGAATWAEMNSAPLRRMRSNG